MNRFIERFSIMFIFWLGLTASLNWQELLVGFFAALFASWASLKLVPGTADSTISFKQWIIFIPVVLIEIVKANVAIAKLVLSPKIVANPGFVMIPTNLKSDEKRWFLSQAITLTPGTVTADMFEDKLLVHWINIEGDDAAIQGDIIKGRFEKILA